MIVGLNLHPGVLSATSISVKIATDLYELQTEDSSTSDQCDRNSDCDSKFINRCAYSLVTSQMSLISQGGLTSKTENCLTAMKQTETKVR